LKRSGEKVTLTHHKLSIQVLHDVRLNVGGDDARIIFQNGVGFHEVRVGFKVDFLEMNFAINLGEEEGRLEMF
jgi:hypothetical protein